jgi:hypothetical protein
MDGKLDAGIWKITLTGRRKALRSNNGEEIA